MIAAIWLVLVNCTYAEDAVSINITPKRCIALHKGQQCFQKVSIQLDIQQPGRYCLYIDGYDQAIRCWSNQELTSITYAFKGTASTTFRLRDRNTGNWLASAPFEVSWVYRSSRKSNASWRLF